MDPPLKKKTLHYLRIRKYNSPEHLRIHNVHSSHHRSTQEGRLEQSEVGHTAGLEVSINRALRATATAIVTHTQQCGSHRRLRCFAVRALRPIGGATLAVAARDDRRAQSTTAVVRPRAVKPGEERVATQLHRDTRAIEPRSWRLHNEKQSTHPVSSIT